MPWWPFVTVGTTHRDKTEIGQQVRHWTTHGPQGPQGLTSRSNDMCFKVSTLTTIALTPALRMACKSGSKSRRAWQNGGNGQDTRKLDLMSLRLIRKVLKYPPPINFMSRHPAVKLVKSHVWVPNSPPEHIVGVLDLSNHCGPFSVYMAK